MSTRGLQSDDEFVHRQQSLQQLKTLLCTQVLAYFTAIVSCVTLFGVMTIPDIIRESADFVTRLQSDSIWVVVLEKIRHGLGCSSFLPMPPQHACHQCMCSVPIPGELVPDKLSC